MLAVVRLREVLQTLHLRPLLLTVKLLLFLCSVSRPHSLLLAQISVREATKSRKRLVLEFFVHLEGISDIAHSETLSIERSKLLTMLVELGILLWMLWHVRDTLLGINWREGRRGAWVLERLAFELFLSRGEQFV